MLKSNDLYLFSVSKIKKEEREHSILDSSVKIEQLREIFFVCLNRGQCLSLSSEELKRTERMDEH